MPILSRQNETTLIKPLDVPFTTSPMQTVKHQAKPCRMQSCTQYLYLTTQMNTGALQRHFVKSLSTHGSDWFCLNYLQYQTNNYRQRFRKKENSYLTHCKLLLRFLLLL